MRHQPWMTYKVYAFSGTISDARGGDISFNASASGGSDPVLDCGVILSNTSGVTIDNALQKISLGQINTNSSNAFYTSFHHLNLNSSYYLRGYVKDDKGYTYSNELNTNTGCMTVDSIFPKSTITSSKNFVIYGKNFGTVTNNIIVTFGNDQGTVIQTGTLTLINDNTLNVNIPSGFASGDKISFSVQRINSTCNYIYIGGSTYTVSY